MSYSSLARTWLLGLTLGAALFVTGASPASARTTPTTLDRVQIQRLVVEEAEGTSLPPSLALAQGDGIHLGLEILTRAQHCTHRV